ncbi:PASTA domain-containing protein [Arthrobacter sulfonylureivorans]|uniref:PASTA domain-containing protein n=1 Tax=Arthrobacter sulfonylureivorans TaxID=2486855 RepID=A0ABY3WD12_9MICC|nr:PASTA domain-containing protein [Arthrobacter sulfonylureivorans]UNK47090.1 PASTA domain-containing protein [Arthrobacter sulfonylureivorans]
MKKASALVAAVALTLTACAPNISEGQNPAEGQSAAEVQSTATPAADTMPSVVDKTVAEARAAMADAGIDDYKLSTPAAESEWMVVGQFPRAGRPLTGAGGITLIVVNSNKAGARADSTTAPPSEVVNAYTVTYSCDDEDYENEWTFESLREVWDEIQVSGDLSCEAELSLRGELTDTEKKALKKAYGSEPGPVDITTLYEICTQMTGIPITGTVGKNQADEAAGAVMLCPDHPKKKKIKKSIAEGLAAAKEQKALDKDRESGKLVGGGSYLVGKEVVPGTWQSQGKKVEDCYWEVSDASGNIIANNFISVAPQFRITVPASAAGFTVSGCAFRWVGP